MAKDIMATATSRRRRQRQRHSPVRRRPSSNSRPIGRAATPTGTSASKPGRPRRPPKHNQQSKIEIAKKGTRFGSLSHLFNPGKLVAVRLGEGVICRLHQKASLTARTPAGLFFAHDRGQLAVPERDNRWNAAFGAALAVMIEVERETPMNPNKARWEKGDFTRIAQSMRESGEALVKGLGITKGLKVLDLGCGDGTTALPAARLGADVLGVDIARNLVEAGNKRAKEQGLTNCKFQEGDASNLHELKDQTFDLVVSIFGAMFAPKPFDVAKEMVRVTRPGGRIVMGNWIPNDPTLVAQILKISAAYSPPPPEGFVSPMTWGVETNVIERFGAAGIPKEKIMCARDTYTFNFPGTPVDFVDVFRRYYGPTMNAFDAAEKSGRAQQLFDELSTLFTSKNTHASPNVTSIPATFLRVTVDVV